MPPDVHPLRPNAIHQSASIESPHAGYAELHCLTNFTFLRGASHPEELVERASALGYAALAITDECSMAGVVKAHIAAKRCQLKLIIGNELTLEDGTKIILLAKNRQGYGELCHIITLARRRSKKGQYRVSLNDFKASTDHLIAIWIPQHRELLETGSRSSALKTLFGEQLWLGAVRALDGFDHVRTQGLQAIASAQTLPVVACGDIQMHASNRKPLLDTLCAIRHGHSVQSAGRLLQGNAERYLKTRAELSELYPQQWLTNTRKIAATCTFSLDELRYS
jgi:error-prone DNA polymerase